MPFDAFSPLEERKQVTTPLMAVACLGGVVLAVVIGALLYAFVHAIAV